MVHLLFFFGQISIKTVDSKAAWKRVQIMIRKLLTALSDLSDLDLQ